ncbi:MAG: EAL and GGDEF domain-containing protein [Wenzhouxiangella sp.]
MTQNTGREGQPAQSNPGDPAESLYLQGMFENSHSVMLLIDPADGAIFDANPAAEYFYGWSRQELRQMKISDINTLPEDEIRRRMQEARKADRNRFHFRHRRADGSVCDVEVLSDEVRAGERNLLYSIVNDISGKVSAEQALRESEQRFRHLIEAAPDAILIQQDMILTYANRAACRLLGTDRADRIVGRNMLDCVHPEDRETVRERTRMLVEDGQRLEPAEIRFLDLNGQGVPTEVACMPLEESGPGSILIFARDISQRRKAESGLRLASTVVDNTSDGIIITDADARIIAVNPAFTEITGYPQSEVIGRNPKLLQSGRQDESFYAGMWEEILEHGSWQGELWNRRRDGTLYPQFTRINTVRDENGRPSHFVAVFTDLSEAHSTEEKLEQLYYHDLLTGLANRQLFRARLARAVAHAGPGRQSVCMLHIDLDGFGHINEGLGVKVGDRLLMGVAGRLQELAGPDQLIARIGADEFAVLVTGEDRAWVLAKDIIRSLATPFSIEDHTVFITASCGLAVCTDPDYDTEALMQHGDAAVHQARAEGGNTCVIYDRTMSRHSRERVLMAAELRSAIHEDRLKVRFQPQIDLDDGSIVGFEALVRWPHPEHGMIPPDRFIPIAEETGLIIDLGRWVLRRTCRQARAWLDKGVAFGSVSVNISGAQVLRGNLDGMVAEILEEIGLPAELLELELTESFLMETGQPVTSILERLRATGIRLAMDDFGTGYSSLAYLKELPFDTLKLDQQFTAKVAEDTRDAAICRVIAALGRELGFRTLAEGIETQAQCDKLRELGCRFGQGYLFSEPVEADAVPELIAN